MLLFLLYTQVRAAGIAQSVLRLAVDRMAEDRILVGARISVPVQAGPEAHPVCCTVATGRWEGA
jgi:hypothetical protein